MESENQTSSSFIIFWLGFVSNPPGVSCQIYPFAEKLAFITGFSHAHALITVQRSAERMCGQKIVHFRKKYQNLLKNTLALPGLQGQ